MSSNNYPQQKIKNGQKSKLDNFCAICGLLKENNTIRFCNKCQKETPSSFKMQVEPESFSLSESPVKLTKKWGDANWAYFPIAYTILLTLTIGIIQLIEISSCYRIMFIVIFVVIEFLLCFFCPRFKNFIVNFFEKSKIEKR